jgi:hypothetical protein
VFGILGFEKYSLDSRPIQPLELCAAQRAYTRNLEHRGLACQRTQGKFVQPLAIVHHVKRRVDVCAGVGSHFYGGQSDVMGFVT